jgi:hypothetical protein
MKRLKKLFILKPSDIPKNWREMYLRIWVEDDAPVPDKERTGNAFQRITGHTDKYMRERHTHMIDDDDCITFFYSDGWVREVACDGGSVGVLVKEVEK